MIDDDDAPLIDLDQWRIVWTRNGAIAQSTTQRMSLHRWLVNAAWQEHVLAINGNYLDCRRANIKHYRITAEDIAYIEWLNDEGWFTQHKWGASKSQLQAIAAEIGISPITVKRIADRAYAQGQTRRLSSVRLSNAG